MNSGGHGGRVKGCVGCLRVWSSLLCCWFDRYDRLCDKVAMGMIRGAVSEEIPGMQLKMGREIYEGMREKERHF